MKIKNELEDVLVVKLRTLVMMSIDKRILLEKIYHLRPDLGLPLEFRHTICQRYPQYFRVVPTPRGPSLELTQWDSELALSAAELSDDDNKVKDSEERNLIIDRPPKFNRVKLPRGLNLSKSETRKISQFRDMSYISPYLDFSHLRSGTLEKEKHACGVIHELLSLTTEKRTLVDHLTHFREEFRFSQQLRGMLIRHPDLFYVSLKGERDSVFLREAYRNSELIDKDPLTHVKEKMRSLVSITRFPRRGGPKKDVEGREEQIDGSDEEGAEEEEESDEEEWSDVDSYLEGEDGENDDDDGDWTDEEGEDVPPNFDDEEEDEDSVKTGLSTSSRKSSSPRKKEEKVVTPVFSDGTPREKW
ncbi:unnamed protein product [Cochlearia groenlandica]